MQSHRILIGFSLVVLAGATSSGRLAAQPTKGTENTPLVSVPLSIHDDIPYAKVRVNESNPLWFIIDSGASGCVIDLKKCRDLGIPTEGRAKGTGAGAGTYEVTFAKDVTFTIDSLKP